MQVSFTTQFCPQDRGVRRTAILAQTWFMLQHQGLAASLQHLNFCWPAAAGPFWQPPSLMPWPAWQGFRGWSDLTLPQSGHQ